LRPTHPEESYVKEQGRPPDGKIDDYQPQMMREKADSKNAEYWKFSSGLTASLLAGP
jgi:hypothetical protein